MSILELVEKEVERKRRVAILDANLSKKIRMGTSAGEDTADAMDLTGKTFNVFDMVMNGLEIASLARETIDLIRLSNLTRQLAEDSKVVTEGFAYSGRAAFGVAAFGVLASYVSFWIDLAGAWAEAKARILKDNAARGFSLGVVLGGNDAGPSFVKENFWMWGKPSYPSYREAELAARNMYNTALASGYNQGRRLSKEQKGRLFKYLHGKLSATNRNFYSGDFKNWTLNTKKGYYSDCAALFRTHNLR